VHLHIIGVCGTFMGGIAAIAREAGHRDRNVYPPMSTQLAALGVDVIEGYEPDQLKLNPDVFVVGNVMSRGNALIEALLDSGRPYESGPAWLARNVLAGRWVLGVAGTHGKTTTTSLLTSILEHAGHAPGFLVGGVPLDFKVSARLGAGVPFVVEADEYDTAFFDKRAKFVHYRPRTAILNNLEHDHADIYPDVASIQKQFHLLLRTVPGNGRLVVNAADRNLAGVLEMGCWTPVERFTAEPGIATDWRGCGERLFEFFGVARRPARRRRRLEHARSPQCRERARRADCGASRRRGRAGGARGLAPLRGRAPPARGAGHGARHRRVRRLRASPDGDHDDT
jgi:UDP-N-acetylmuramate: L-alanyl-gamma-D-glutamyl-meso-diaminopimelate ligase